MLILPAPGNCEEQICVIFPERGLAQPGDHSLAANVLTIITIKTAVITLFIATGTPPGASAKSPLAASRNQSTRILPALWSKTRSPVLILVAARGSTASVAEIREEFSVLI